MNKFDRFNINLNKIKSLFLKINNFIIRVEKFNCFFNFIILVFKYK